MPRPLKYSEAIAEATCLAMRENEKLFLMGEGVDDPKGAFGTTRSAFLEFGKERVIDTPLSEAAVTSIGIGAAIAGRPNIMLHMRSEFLLYAMDSIVNHAAKWRYMNDGQFSVPITIRCLVGRGWGQAAQHSQSFHSLFAQIPGLKVVLPSSASEAKGLLLSSIQDPNPVIFIEHRWLYDRSEEVPEGIYYRPLDEARVVREGKDITCVALSYSVVEALEVADQLSKSGVEMEVIDPRSVRPLDLETIHTSVKKTGRMMVMDIGHRLGGMGAEVVASLVEQGIDLKSAPLRIGLPDAPTPCASHLEAAYYPQVSQIVDKVLAQFRVSAPASVAEKTTEFSGPF